MDDRRCSANVSDGSPDTYSDAELVRDAQRGGVQSMEILIRRHAGALGQYLAHKTPCRAETEDLAQETWLRVWRFIQRVDPDRPFRPWLFRVATRVAASRYRRSDRHGPLDEATLANLVSPPGGGGHLQDEVSVLWRRAAEVLPPRQREALWLFYMEEMSIAEVAIAMQVPRGLVKVWLHRARTRLARELSLPSGSGGAHP